MKEQAEIQFELGLSLLQHGAFERAVFQFELALSLDPSHERATLALAEARRRLAEPAPAPREPDVAPDDEVGGATDVDRMRARFARARAQRAFDEAFCMAAALAFLGEADAEQRRFFEDHRPRGVPGASGRLDEELWRRALVHADADATVGAIFAGIAPAALRAKLVQLAAKHQTPALDPRLLQDPATSKAPLVRAVGSAAAGLGLHCPRLYFRSDVPGPLVVVAADVPTSMAGSSHLDPHTPAELAFIAGKHLAMYRPEHVLKAYFPTVTEATVLFFGGIWLVAPEAPMPPDIAKQIVATGQMLRQYVQPMEVEGVRLAAKVLLGERRRVDVRRWWRAVEMTCARAGLLVCGDLEAARKVLAAEWPQPGGPSAQELMADLVGFWVSPEHAMLRGALGIALH